MEDQQCREPTGSTPIPPHPPSRKQPGRPAESGSHAPSPSGLVAPQDWRRGGRGGQRRRQRVRVPAKTKRYGMHSHCRDRVGSCRPSHIRRRTALGMGSCCGLPQRCLPVPSADALLERAEELEKRDLGDETWDEWLEKQGKTGRRCRSRGGRGNSHRGK